MDGNRIPLRHRPQGAFVYWLVRETFNLLKRVRFPYALPSVLRLAAKATGLHPVYRGFESLRTHQWGIAKR